MRYIYTVLLLLISTFCFATKDTVDMVNFAFEPAKLEISRGDTVVWVNKTITKHTATSGEDCTNNGIWDSGLLEKGETFTYVFSDTGNFNYYCIPHCQLDMVGVVSVGEKIEAAEVDTTTEYPGLPWHPRTVHFPIALTITGLLFVFIGVIIKREPYLKIAQAILIIALLGSIVAIITGFISLQNVAMTKNIQYLVQIHQTLGIVFACVLLVLILWQVIRRRKMGKKELWGFLIALFVTAGTVGFQGHIGGLMVYLEGAGTKPGFEDRVGEEQLKSEEKEDSKINLLQF